MPGPYTDSDIRNYVGIFKQAVKGTGGAPTVWAPYVPSVDLDHALTINKILEASGGYRATYSEKISEIPTGKFSFLCRPSFAARVAAFLLGVDTFTAGSPNLHVLTDDLTTDYLAFEQNLADEAIERFVDGVVAEITWSVDPATRAIRAMVTWVGTVPSFQAAATAESYEVANPFLISDGAFTVDGAGASNVRGFSLTVRFVYAMPLINDVVAAYLVKIRQEVDISVTQLATDIAAEYRKTHTGTTGGTTYQKIAQAGAFIGDFNYGAGAGLREMKLEVPMLDYDSAAYTPLNPEGDVVEVTRTGHGRFDLTNAMFKGTFKNADAAAYVT